MANLIEIPPPKKSHHAKPKRGRIRLMPVESPVVNKKRITVAGMKKFVNAVLAAYAPLMVPEALDTLRHAMNLGDIKAAEQTLKSFGVLSSPGISVTQNNVNTATSDNASHRSFESIIRNSNLKQGKVIDVAPETRQIECPLPSVRNSRPVPAGSAIQESAS